MQTEISTLDALFEAPMDLDESFELGTAPGVVDGEDYDVRMFTTIGTIAVKC